MLVRLNRERSSGSQGGGANLLNVIQCFRHACTFNEEDARCRKILALLLQEKFRLDEGKITSWATPVEGPEWGVEVTQAFVDALRVGDFDTVELARGFMQRLQELNAGDRAISLIEDLSMAIEACEQSIGEQSTLLDAFHDMGDEPGLA